MQGFEWKRLIALHRQLFNHLLEKQMIWGFKAVKDDSYEKVNALEEPDWNRNYQIEDWVMIRGRTSPNRTLHVERTRALSRC